MKTKILKSTILIAILGVALWSCKKESQPLPIASDTVQINALYQSRIMTDEQVNDLGKYHNKYLGEMFSDFDYSGDNTSELNSKLNENEFSFNLDSMINSFSNTEDYLVAQLGNNYSFIEDSYEFINSAFTNPTYFNSQINLLVNEVESQDINGRVKDVLLTYFSVLKNAAEYWTSETYYADGIQYIGGKQILMNLNKYNDINDFSNGQAGLSKGSKILAADAMGAAGGLIGGGIFSWATDVICPWKFFGRIAFGAAWASGTAALVL